MSSPRLGEVNKVRYGKRVYTLADSTDLQNQILVGASILTWLLAYCTSSNLTQINVNLNAGWWIQAKNGRDYAVFSTYEDRRERVTFLSPYKIRVMRPSAMAELARFGSFGITPFSYYAPNQQDSLVWNTSIKAWVTGDPADGKYLSLKGGTVDGDVTIKGDVTVKGNIEMDSGTIQGKAKLLLRNGCWLRLAALLLFLLV